MKFENIQAEQTQSLGIALGKYLFPHALITLTGDLGAGKTTLTKSIAKGLGITQIVNSPTFTILKIYESGRIPLYHFDAYRLEDASEDLGFEEYIDGEGICVIEWPMYIEDILPEERLEIEISYIDEVTRTFTLKPIGSRYEALCQEVEQCIVL